MTMKVLPRYPFRESKVGCADHGSPDCLCDVHVTSVTPILTHIPHKYHAEALKELDDDTVSSRNIYEFFQIVLGMEKLERALDGANPPRSYGSDAWANVPEQVIENLLMHARVDTPKQLAMIELEGLDLPAAQVKAIGRKYVDIQSNHRAKDRARGDRPLQWAQDAERTEGTLANRKARRISRHVQRMETDPEYAAAYRERKRAQYRRKRASQGKLGSSWKDSGVGNVGGNHFLFPTAK